MTPKKMKFQLKPDNRNASNETLLEDLRRAAKQLGQQTIITRDYNKIGRFGYRTIKRRFDGWNEALEKAGLEKGRQPNISDEELIHDIKRVVLEIAPLELTKEKYKEKGKYSTTTIEDRFGWNNIKEELNLETHCPFATEKELFENLEAVWITLGRAPGRREMKKPLSRYSDGPYKSKSRWGSWRKALEAFVEYINAGSEESSESEQDIEHTSVTEREKLTSRHKTKRYPSNKQKIRVLFRDGNKCKWRGCGITVKEDNMQFDHIIPWVKGGETVVENLQILCAKHNRVKGGSYEEN